MRLLEKYLGFDHTLAVLFLACVVVTWARPAHAECRTAATAEVESLNKQSNQVVTSATFADATGSIELFSPKECPEGKTCLIVHFQAGSKPTRPPADAPADFVPDREWHSVGTGKSTPGCSSELFDFAFTKAPTSTQAHRSDNGNSVDDCPKDQKKTVACAHTDLIKATAADSARQSLKAERNAYGESPSVNAIGSAQVDASGIAAETLQIVGQIVVDRASAKAYGLLQTKLEHLLRCPSEDDRKQLEDDKKQLEDDNKAHADVATIKKEQKNVEGDEQKLKTRFPATCNVLASLRIQDIAMAPRLLAAALSQDIFGVLKPLDGKTNIALGSEVRSVVTLLVTKPNLPQELAVRSVLDALLGHAAGQGAFETLSKAEKAVVLGVVAFAKCPKDGSSKSVATCDTASIIDQLDPDPKDADVKPAAREIAARLVALAAAPKNDAPRVQLAVDTLLASACMLEISKVDPTAAPGLSCPEVDTITDLSKPSEAVNELAFMAAFADAALTKDSARLIVVAAKLVDLKLGTDPDAQGDTKRALRLLGGLLDYAATYAATPDQSTDGQQAAHDRRTQILESLTNDMSDRTGREGDDVFSLGGALRIVGGTRIGLQKTKVGFFGPLSLPLGLAYTHIPQKESGCGFHMQLDAVDLGNYLALQDGPKVKKPDLGDAFAPSLSVGLAWGVSLPFVAAATVGWTPQFVLDRTQPTKRGTLNLGLTFGLHVPLIDLN